MGFLIYWFFLGGGVNNFGIMIDLYFMKIFLFDQVLFGEEYLYLVVEGFGYLYVFIFINNMFIFVMVFMLVVDIVVRIIVFISG